MNLGLLVAAAARGGGGGGGGGEQMVSGARKRISGVAGSMCTRVGGGSWCRRKRRRYRRAGHRVGDARRRAGGRAGGQGRAARMRRWPTAHGVPPPPPPPPHPPHAHPPGGLEARLGGTGAAGQHLDLAKGAVQQGLHAGHGAEGQGQAVERREDAWPCPATRSRHVRVGLPCRGTCAGGSSAARLPGGRCQAGARPPAATGCRLSSPAVPLGWVAARTGRPVR